MMAQYVRGGDVLLFISIIMLGIESCNAIGLRMLKLTWGGYPPFHSVIKIADCLRARCLGVLARGN
jgi:hypothetical protein